MNKQLIIGLAAATLLTACSQEEVLDVNMDSNVIRVGADAGSASRAANSYCPHILPASFQLTAVHQGSDINTGIYFKDDLMNQVNSGTVYSFAASDRYWPDNALDFYAWHCTSGAEFTLENTQTYENKDTTLAKFVDFTVADQVAAQTDLIYARAFNQTNGETPVNLAFNHALSQVTFKAKVENENIRVAIKEVGIINLLNKGTFIWPDTIPNFDEFLESIKNLAQTTPEGEGTSDSRGENAAQTGQGTTIPAPGIRGGWIVDSTAGSGTSMVGEDNATGYPGVFNVYNTQAAGTATYNVTLPETVKIAANAVAGDDSWKTGEQTLTAAPTDHVAEGGWGNVMQLLPQYSALTVNDEMLDELGQMKRAPQRRMKSSYNRRLLASCSLPFNTKRVYIRLVCDITTTNADGTEVTLYSSTKNGATQYLYIPVSIFWEPGYLYVYTINFTKDGSGGITDPEDPEDVLDNVRISANVAEYNEEGVSTSDEQVNMKR